MQSNPQGFIPEARARAAPLYAVALQKLHEKEEELKRVKQKEELL